MTPRRWFLAIFLLALGVRLLYAALTYSPDFSAFESGDYPLYRIGAEHFIQQRDFTNSLFLVRPPLFPLWVALLGVQPVLVIAANIAFGALIAPVGMTFARQLQSDNRIVMLVGVILALDPTGVIYSAFLGPEPIANLLLIAALVCLLLARSTQRSVFWGILAGLALMASAYTRPSAYLMWIPLVLGWILIKPRHWRSAAAVAVIGIVGVGVWTFHNALVFATPSFSTVAPYTMVYYHAASVERIATDRPVEEIYVSINRRVVAYAGLPIDLETVDEGTRHGFLAAPPKLQDALNRVAFEIFTAYPLITLATFPVGFARMYGLFPDTITPSTITLIAVNVVFTLGALGGAWLAVRRRHWLLLYMTALPILYFTAGTLVVKSAGMDTRERSMLEPMLALLFALTCVSLWDRLAQRRTSHTVP